MIAAEDLKVGMTLVVTDTQEPHNYENGDTLEVTLLHPNTRLITGKLESGAVLKFCFEEVSKAEVDMVSNPPHYTAHPSGVECIEITRHMGFNVGNAVKYLWRADLKGAAIQDLEKAAFYIQDEITKRKAASA